MRVAVIFSIFFLCCFAQAQNSLDELLKSFNTESVPYISVQELIMPKTEAVILDAREIKEYKVSHIKDAIFVGYNNFSLETVKTKLKNIDQMIVVYCSLGIRSENIGEKLKNAGYTNVYNLYGGIFEWKNNQYPVFDADEKPTDNVHVFSKNWSKWLLKGNKIYD